MCIIFGNSIKEICIKWEKYILSLKKMIKKKCVPLWVSAFEHSLCRHPRIVWTWEICHMILRINNEHHPHGSENVFILKFVSTSWLSLSHVMYFTNAVLPIENTESGPPWSTSSPCTKLLENLNEFKQISERDNIVSFPIPPLLVKRNEGGYGVHYWNCSTLTIRIFPIM